MTARLHHHITCSKAVKSASYMPFVGKYETTKLIVDGLAVQDKGLQKEQPQRSLIPLSGCLMISGQKV